MQQSIANRVRQLNSVVQEKPGAVCYWMSRDQRVEDNWALLYAQHLALEHKEPLVVLFCLVPQFLGATLRQYDFMLKGLKEVAIRLSNLNMPFLVIQGEPQDVIERFIHQHNIAAIVCDFDPLRIKRRWKEEIVKKVKIPVMEVDAHNIVPVWLASEKQEWSAYTFRKKVSRILAEYLTRIPKPKRHPFTHQRFRPQSFTFDEAAIESLIGKLKIDFSVKPVDWIEPGEKPAQKAMRSFINERLNRYADERNDPTKQATSMLSPYLHFGHLSAQRLALEVVKSDAREDSKQAFLEELIIRRELAENFCCYNGGYDDIAGAPRWAQETIKIHEKDRRAYIYDLESFENAYTHDKLWNAAQMQMVKKGWMHGYMRMYWAKKILEWTPSAKEALSIAIYLNDRYELDGRDPNGYVGIMWSICGLHDRPWPERPVFGKIRYMSANGMKRKFDTEAFIKENLDA